MAKKSSVNVDQNDVVERLAESLWAADNSELLEVMEEQGAEFRAVRPQYLQKARLLMIKISNRGGSLTFSR